MQKEFGPLGAFRRDLSQNRLSLEERTFLGEEIVRNKSTVKELAERYHLKERTLQSYAYLIRRGGIRNKYNCRDILGPSQKEELRRFIEDNDCRIDLFHGAERCYPVVERLAKEYALEKNPETTIFPPITTNALRLLYAEMDINFQRNCFFHLPKSPTTTKTTNSSNAKKAKRKLGS